MKNQIFIAEVKTRSPFGFRSQKTWDELFEVADNCGDWISIHVDPRWGGRVELIKKARLKTNKPILAKGINAKDEDIEKALKAGANYVLVVGRIPKIHTDKCLIEVNNLSQLSKVPKNLMVVWNQRDLRNGESKTETFEEARSIWGGWLAQASLISSYQDISKGADGYIVGTNLIKFANQKKSI